MPRVRKTNFDRLNSQKFPKARRTPDSAAMSEGSSAKALNLSVTIRTGRGVNLGSNSSLSLALFLQQFDQYSFSVEKTQLQGHWQGAIYQEPSIFQQSARSIRNDIIDIFNQTDPEWNDKNEKHAVKVSEHDNWIGLVGYTIKERDPLPEYYKLKYVTGSRYSPWIENINPKDIMFGTKKYDKDLDNFIYYRPKINNNLI